MCFLFLPDAANKNPDPGELPRDLKLTDEQHIDHSFGKLSLSVSQVPGSILGSLTKCTHAWISGAETHAMISMHYGPEL